MSLGIEMGSQVGLEVSEKQFQQQVLDLAEMLGWLCYHTFDSRRSAAGFPDLVLAHGRHGVIFAELKSERGKRSPAQVEWGRVLTAAGARVFTWRPSMFDSIAEVLAGRAG